MTRPVQNVTQQLLSSRFRLRGVEKRKVEEERDGEREGGKGQGGSGAMEAPFVRKRATLRTVHVL